MLSQRDGDAKSASAEDKQDSRSRFQFHFRSLPRLGRDGFFIGCDNFQRLAEEKRIIVDKSGFIKEVLDVANLNALFTRPHGFGATSLLTMLECFLDCSLDHEKVISLFNTMEIWSEENRNYRHHLGQYSVVFLTLKNINAGKFEDILQEFAYYFENMWEDMQKKYQLKPTDDFDFFNDDINEDKLQSFLEKLINHIYKNCGKNTFLLVDEYNIPIKAAYRRSKFNNTLEHPKGDYLKTLSFMKKLFYNISPEKMASLKGVVITGVTPISKESVFSESLNIYSVKNDRFASYFGFTEAEVLKQLQDAFGIKRGNHLFPLVSKYYAGYHIGSYNLSSPWSIARFIEDNRKNDNGKMVYNDYWLNSNYHELVTKFFVELQDDEIQTDLARLISGGSITKNISVDDSCFEIENEPKILWGFLLHHGYLTVRKNLSSSADDIRCELAIPNQELLEFFCSLTRKPRIEQVDLREGESLTINSEEISQGVVVIPKPARRNSASEVKASASSREKGPEPTFIKSLAVNPSRLDINSSGPLTIYAGGRMFHHAGGVMRISTAPQSRSLLASSKSAEDQGLRFFPTGVSQPSTSALVSPLTEAQAKEYRKDKTQSSSHDSVLRSSRETCLIL